MLVECFNSSVLPHTLTTSFSIPMKWLSLACSTAVYIKDCELITFQMETKSKRNLTKKQFTQILQLESGGPFETMTPNQVLSMLNEMGEILRLR